MSSTDLLGSRFAHICVDMQRMFAEDTPWFAPWLGKVLPAVESIAVAAPEQTIFTRFIPPQTADEAPGAWRTYYEEHGAMTGAELAPHFLDLVPSLAKLTPPGAVIDKGVYSPWLQPELQSKLQRDKVDTLIVTGGETDVCVLATVLGAIDLGYRVVVPTDAVFGSADETHDAMISIYNSRFHLQLTTCETRDVLAAI